MNTLRTETEKLVLRLIEEDDYSSWLTEYENRLTSQHKYDEGKLDMSICTKEWFSNLVTKHHKMAKDDYVYVFGVFRKVDNAHIRLYDNYEGRISMGSVWIYNPQPVLEKRLW